MKENTIMAIRVITCSGRVKIQILKWFKNKNHSATCIIIGTA